MRILYFTRDYTSHDHRFLSALSQTEHEVFSLRLERRGSQLEDRPLPVGVRQIPWVGGTSPVERSEYGKYTQEFTAVMKEVLPDVVHAGSIQTAGLIAAMAKVPTLVSMSWGYDMLVDAQKSPQLQKDTLTTLKQSKIVVCDCDAVHSVLTSLGFPAERIVQFPWGTDLEHFNPQNKGADRKALNWSNDRFVILSLRAWEAIYDVKTVVRAFINAVKIEPSLYLVLLGGGSQQNELRQMLEKAGVMDSVLFGGRISYGQLPKYYRAADVYVSASLTDGSSVSLLEAMACGTPAIVSDIDGNREWIHEDVEGWLFPVGDADALSAKFLNAVQNQMNRTAMQMKVRAVAEERADWQKNYPKLLGAYKMALKETAPYDL